MKLLTVLARGIEGCGVTLNSIKFTDYVNTLKGHSAVCVANTDIKWGRGNVHKHNITQLSFTKQLDEVKKLVDDADVIIFMCTPLKKSPDEVKTSFVDLLDYAYTMKKKLTAYCQFDHKIRSLRTNMYSEPEWHGIWSKFDIIFNHSHTNDFVVKYLDKEKIKHGKLVCRGDYGLQNLFATDFQSLVDKFWKTFKEKTPKSIKFIGRSSAWKGPWAFRDFHYKHLMDKGWTASAEGIELSIGTLAELYKQIKPKKVTRDDVCLDYVAASKANVKAVDEESIKLEAGKPLYMMPPYNHDPAMERLSKCQFGIELLMLDDNFSKDVIENAMFEIVAVGCIPVFRKRWAEMFTVYGKPLASYGQEKTGTVFLDEEHPDEAVKLLQTLSEDGKMYDKWRHAAYEFYFKLFDVQPVYDKMLEVLASELKTKVAGKSRH